MSTSTILAGVSSRLATAPLYERQDIINETFAGATIQHGVPAPYLCRVELANGEVATIDYGGAAPAIVDRP